jgi:hypothetical protein
MMSNSSAFARIYHTVLDSTGTRRARSRLKFRVIVTLLVLVNLAVFGGITLTVSTWCEC